jgi:hypothetical protein
MAAEANVDFGLGDLASLSESSSSDERLAALERRVAALESRPQPPDDSGAARPPIGFRPRP